MKLYVWVGPYHVKWGSSMVFAIAENEEAARKEIRENSTAWRFAEFKREAAPLKSIVLRAPTRILDLPCAEWHEWSE